MGASKTYLRGSFVEVFNHAIQMEDLATSNHRSDGRTFKAQGRGRDREAPYDESNRGRS